METEKLQKEVSKVFKDNFGYTPLNERLQDIQREFFELMKWTDVRNLKEEAGDLMASLIALHEENDWSFDQNVLNTLEKIKSRRLQYKTLGRKTRVAIYGGAFDPITNGHIQVAQFLLNSTKEFDEVWIMPAYKHMYGKKMVSTEHRIKMCELAAKVDKRIKIFNYEIENQLAGETYYFVKKLKEEAMNEQYHFSIAIGLDNANTFDKWVNYDLLERLIRFVIIPRPGYKPIDNAWYFKEPHIYLHENPNALKISSTEVRDSIEILHEKGQLFKIGKDAFNDMISEEVFEYIRENKLYI